METVDVSRRSRMSFTHLYGFAQPLSCLIWGWSNGLIASFGLSTHLWQLSRHTGGQITPNRENSATIGYFWVPSLASSYISALGYGHKQGHLLPSRETGWTVLSLLLPWSLLSSATSLWHTLLCPGARGLCFTLWYETHLYISFEIC